MLLKHFQAPLCIQRPSIAQEGQAAIGVISLLTLARSILLSDDLSALVSPHSLPICHLTFLPQASPQPTCILTYSIVRSTILSFCTRTRKPTTLATPHTHTAPRSACLSPDTARLLNRRPVNSTQSSLSHQPARYPLRSHRPTEHLRTLIIISHHAAHPSKDRAI